LAGSRPTSDTAYIAGPARARDRFVLTPYFVDPATGEYVPEVPARCSWTNGDTRPCRIGRKDTRDRCTGPCFPLWVLHCKTHGPHFTVYPPGHFPWGHEAVVQVPPDGTTPHITVAEDQDVVPEILEDTLFEPVWEASQGRLWSSECDRDEGTWRSVQVRKVEDAAQLVGVAGDVDDAGRDVQHAELLGVPAQLLRDARRSIAQEPGLISRAKAVIRIVMAVIRAGGSFVDRLIVAGFRVGLWGRPFRWMANLARLLTLAR
jgi:hypothetical protein